MKYLAVIRNPVLPEQIGGGANVTRSMGAEATGKILSNVLGFIFVFAFIIGFIYLLTGGFHWITSGGDKANLERARNKIIHAIVGLIVVASTWAILRLTGQFLGIDIEALPLPVMQP